MVGSEQLPRTTDEPATGIEGVVAGDTLVVVGATTVDPGQAAVTVTVTINCLAASFLKILLDCRMTET